MSRFPLRLPDTLQADIERLATEHGRSINQEIARACETWVNEHQTCSLCSDKAAVFCQLCKPPAWFCSLHYMQKHAPDEEESDES